MNFILNGVLRTFPAVFVMTKKGILSQSMIEEI